MPFSPHLMPSHVIACCRVSSRTGKGLATLADALEPGGALCDGINLLDISHNMCFGAYVWGDHKVSRDTRCAMRNK